MQDNIQPYCIGTIVGTLGFVAISKLVNRWFRKPLKIQANNKIICNTINQLVLIYDIGNVIISYNANNKVCQIKSNKTIKCDVDSANGILYLNGLHNSNIDNYGYFDNWSIENCLINAQNVKFTGTGSISFIFESPKNDEN